ncbi:sugar nucleotidyltransferase [Patescibacteria group bacterium]|nr:sugar nucleotidyltransferase [Patescibacteria group bacterium]
MKGIVIAGGKGTRLSPLTDPLSKHLLPVYDKPMIVHVVETLVQGGVDQILVVLTDFHPGLYLEMLGNGSSLGCRLEYCYARNTKGPGKTMLMGKEWVSGEDFALILADSMFFCTLTLEGKKAPHMFVMPLEGFDDPRKYAQVTVSEETGKVSSIYWKPGELFSNFIQSTCFVLPAEAFERLEGLDNTQDHVMNITALTEGYVEEGEMAYSMLPPRSFIDCGTVDALLTAQVRRWEVVNGRKWSCP